MNEVVIVTGLPRSGTSLMMQMLEAGGFPCFYTESRKPDCYNPKGYFEHNNVFDFIGDAGKMQEIRGHAIKVVAEYFGTIPTNEKYRVIVMRRSGMEVAASQTRMGIAPKGHQFVNLPDYYDTFMHGFSGSLRSYVHVVNWCEVWYPEIITNPEKEAKRIAFLLGKGLNIGAMVACVDLSLYKSRF